ncbi:MAG: phenylalanyl-tRNA synthetase alpha chain [Parcubacteria group bacterium Gr01-1014_70]|nr:MAG: phenylalanyl-tRNA synthetase alpha chain [Parcubacteria group bacterium Gr01-1014_70]
MQNVDELKKEALAAIQSAGTLEALRNIEVGYLGRSGKITRILRGLKDVPESERKERGKEANAIREELEAEIAEHRSQLEDASHEEQLAQEKIDITQPGAKLWRGGLHPLTLLQRDMVRIFSSLGFGVVTGPEVETEWYNFDALNIPADHPSRDMWDTFWLRQQFPKEKLLLRTHTSPVQIRYMERHQPPFRIIVPGRVFRYEATDATHDVQFYQLEGLMVGKDISVAHFKHVIAQFFGRLFKKEITIRLRPSYFPFVEPGFEVDMSCIMCAGKGCSVCKRTGWLEMAGAGMVHPNVFRNAGIDPRQWRGFAFGFGIDRIAMMKYKIPDIRLFYGGDVRFLKQF